MARAGADPELLCEEGGGGARGRSVNYHGLGVAARKRGRCARGVGQSPSRFLLFSYVISARFHCICIIRAT